MDYKNAGVDIEAGYKSVELMKQHIAKTMRPEVLGGIGGFSGAFSMNSFKDMEEPTLVSGTDGVGTKLKLAFIMDKHDTVGIDCVAMCVNDIACAGGEPLFFLDYIACGKNYPEKIAEIVKGVAEGCSQSSAALIGGETAEMPGFYPVDEYDLAGFAVGVVDKKDLITGENLNTGDVLIGMASSGVHSNGFSLVRKVFEMTKESLDTYYDELGTTLGEALIAPTKIYVKALKSIKDAGVKIVNADSKVDEADQDMVDCFVTADCYTAGYTAGEYLAEKLEKDATLGALNYSQLSVIADRFTGMRDALKDKGRDDVTIVEKDCTDLSAIASYTEDMLIGNPEISAFLCLNDNTALTCYGTCAQMNKADCIVIGFDGSPAGKQSIADGQMTGTMVYSPVDLAKTSLDAGIKLAKGETVDKEAQVEMWMINSDNIKDYDLESWD